jgi:hypothetical protein
VAHPAYGLAGLAGFTLGILYALDGWRSDTADLDLKDSPRVKNLLWVMGGGFIALIGDVKELDPDARKPLVLFWYFLLFLAAVVAIVGTWGIVVTIQRTAAWIRRLDFGYGLTDAVGDYFFYGYRYYRRKASEAKEDRAGRFHANYLEQVTYAVAAAGSASLGNRDQVAELILKCISAVVKNHHSDDKDALGIRANVMLLKECTEEDRERLLFVGDKRNTIKRCLVPVAYDVNENRAPIAIPVPDNPNEALFGAPKALIHPDGIAIVDDSSDIAVETGLSMEVRQEVVDYFKTKLFRSFASLRIIGRGKPIGVVNIDARIPRVFGNTDDEKKRLAHYLLPFCAAIGNIYTKT